MIIGWLLAVPMIGLFVMLLLWRRPVALAGVALAVSLVTCCLGLALLAAGPAPVTMQAGGWPPPWGILLRADGLSGVMVALTGLVFVAASAVQFGATRTAPDLARNPGYYLAFPFLLLGLNGVCLTGDAFNFYVFFELVAIASYLLVAMGAHDPLEAAWKYSAQSVFGSVSLLVGIVLLYGATGTLTIGAIAAHLDAPAVWAAPFFLIAFLLKGALFPFHYWQPDAHAAATTAGSMLLAGALINVGLYGFFRFGPLLLGPEQRWLLVAIGGGSGLFGAAAAWGTADAKRLLGFSSISQLGFVLMAVGWGTVTALAAGLAFLVSHALAKALLFATTGALAAGGTSTRLRDLAGAGVGRPWLSGAYLLGMVSLAGLPPTAGFAAKLALLREGLGLAAWPAVAVIGVGSLMTLAYGIRAYQQLCWSAPPATAAPVLPWPHRWVLVSLSGCVVLGGVMAEPVWRRCLASAQALMPAVAAGGHP
jgi:multicomponent Na+:H+ antiporter subunit D